MRAALAGHGPDRHPGHGRDGERHTDDHDGVEQGGTDASGGSGADSEPVPRTERRGGEQADNDDEHEAGQDACCDREPPVPDPAGDQRRSPAAADGGSGNQEPPGSAPGGIHPGELGQDDVRFAELGHRGFGGQVWSQALAEIELVCLGQPISQLRNNRRRQLRRQYGQVIADHAGVRAWPSLQRGADHGREVPPVSPPARQRPAARRGQPVLPPRRPPTTDQDPAISPACSSRRSAG